MNRPQDAATKRSGLLFAVSAYVLWGILPGYFVLLLPASAWEIVGWRILFALVFCALLLTITRTWATFVVIVRSPRLMLLMGSAGVFIFTNWIVFVLASFSGNVLATSLGYFINPLITVLLGVVVLREKLRALQWVAVALGGVAIVVLAIGYGEVPWFSLVLAVSFALYGLVKKQAGNRVGAIAGLLVETMWLAVPAAGLWFLLA